MKHVYLRLFVSTFGAFVITICLYLLMIVLIRVDYKPAEDTITREYKTVEKLNAEITIEHKTKLKPKLKKAEETPPAPAKNTFFTRKLPSVTPADQSSRAITNPQKPVILSKVAPSPPRASELLKNTELQGNSRRRQNQPSGRGSSGSTGQGDGSGGLSQCSMSFTLLEGGKIQDLSWLNCVDGSIADEAEDALYAWIDEKNADFKALNAKPGDRLEFTFQR